MQHSKPGEGMTCLQKNRVSVILSMEATMLFRARRRSGEDGNQMTNLTKRAMADALKKRLGRYTLEHITIQDVTDDANVSRKTFYYHFHDIYDLVEWMLMDDCRSLAQTRDGRHWLRNVATVLSYATENRRWVMNIYASMDRSQLERILRKLVAPLIEESFDQAVNGRPVNEADRSFVLEVLTYGVTGLFLSWVGEGMESRAAFLQDRLAYFFEDSIQYMADRCAADVDQKE